MTLSHGVDDDESDHAALGTATHSLIERCLATDTDGWEHVGRAIGTFTVTKAMANSAQVFVSLVRKAHPERNQGNCWVERRFHCPTIHELFYGTSDLVFWDAPARTLHIWDYKNGSGVVVEVEDNEQGQYYAAGALEDLMLWGAADKVVIHIVQPNAFHQDGPHRTWDTTPNALAAWLEDVLVPGIERALVSTEAASGDHCRFCPARSRACPQLMQDMDELEAMMSEVEKKGADALTNEQVGRFLHLLGLAKIVGAAANKTAFHRMQNGASVPGFKLVSAKANRVFRDEMTVEGQPVKLAEAARAAFGSEAFTAPELKSPAQLDDLPMGKHFTSQWAYKPDTGLTVAKDTDQRTGISKDVKSLFTPVAAPVAAPAVVAPVASAQRRSSRRAAA